MVRRHWWRRGIAAAAETNAIVSADHAFPPIATVLLLLLLITPLLMPVIIEVKSCSSSSSSRRSGSVRVIRILVKLFIIGMLVFGAEFGGRWSYRTLEIKDFWVRSSRSFCPTEAPIIITINGKEIIVLFILGRIVVGIELLHSGLMELLSQRRRFETLHFSEFYDIQDN